MPASELLRPNDPERRAEDGNSAYALERLRRYLDAGETRSGGRMPTERQLAETLGIGRRAVRRALEVLEAEGLIWRRQGSGTFAGPLPAENSAEQIATTDFLEIMEVRLRLEPQLAALAAMRAKPAQIARMHELADRIVQCEDADARELWDGTLHRQIAQAAGNALFLSLFDTVNRLRQDEAWQAIRERARGGNGTRDITLRQHHAIIDAIAARDPQAAANEMRQHLLMLQEKLIRQTSLDGSET
ncbi:MULTISPECIES: FadR/GntR family transcriptional regulator [Paracoccus]|uniref:FCD domain-containing protein n=1 Tax=Paracoccus litorisediminis TaxID=2006130 RepID=A0A844HK28_9RHOB|nr:MULTISPECIES: FCD domain-containing protein [Paracoccus]MBD9527654.1 FadR family transcriptional regulator [Paracoccus sp. PAR01]MTH60290.1 FCD domain-containing protein [Paracoccus litorisediminis]